MTAAVVVAALAAGAALVALAGLLYAGAFHIRTLDFTRENRASLVLVVTGFALLVLAVAGALW